MPALSTLTRWAWPLLIAASVLAMPGLHAAPAPVPAQLSLRIEVYAFAGFHVLTNRTTIASSAGRYRITTDLDTRGIVSLFIDLNSHSEVDGRFIDGAPFPLAYHSEVKRNGVDRRYRIDYAGQAPLASEWAPPGTQWQSLVAPAQLRGTVDQLTAYFIVERQLAEHGTCSLIVPVFDGHGRYNLRFRDAGSHHPPGPASFAGPTHVCEVTRDDIAGFAGNRDPSEGTYQKGWVWYAALGPGGQMVPVRIDYETEFGIVTGYLAELSGPDGDHRFAK